MKKTRLNSLESSLYPFEDSLFVGGGKTWAVPYLYEQVKKQKIKPEWVNLRHLNLTGRPWEGGNIKSLHHFTFHALRVRRVDLSHPIIMDWQGQVMDGHHRIVAAILDGRTRIQAYRFDEYIDPDGTEEGE